MLFVGQPLYAAVAFAGCYLLGAVSALVSAAVLRRTLVKGTARPMVLELPSYKVPSLTNALISGYSLSSGGDRPSESISINFTKIEYKHIPYDDKNKAGTPVTVSYDLSTTKSG